MVSPFVSVIIPTYNRKNHLEKCLDSVFRIDYPIDKYEIIVVDDGSTDGTPELLREVQTNIQNLRFFRQGNKGCAAARNLGVKNAKGEILLFTDDDCLVEKGWVIQHLKYYNNEKVGGVGGTLWPTKMNYIEGYKIAKYLDEYTQFMQVTDAKSGRGLATCNCSYRKEMFDIAGLFDEDFITGSDPEFSKRVMLTGYSIIKDPSIKVYHLKIESFKSYIRTAFKRSCGVILEKIKYNNLSLFDFLPISVLSPRHIIGMWRKFKQVRMSDMYFSILIKFLVLVIIARLSGWLGRIYYYYKANMFQDKWP